MEAPFKPNLYVVARFLDRLSEDKEWTRSSLQRACGVNYDIFRRYLQILEDKGFAQVADGEAAVVSMTDAGRDMRRQLRDLLVEFMDPGRREAHPGKSAPVPSATRANSSRD